MTAIDRCPYCHRPRFECAKFSEMLPSDWGRVIHWVRGEAQYGADERLTDGSLYSRTDDDPFSQGWEKLLEDNNLIEILPAFAWGLDYCYPEGDAAGVLVTMREGRLIWVADTFWKA